MVAMHRTVAHLLSVVYANDWSVDLWLSGYSVESNDSSRVSRGTIGITPCLTAVIFCQPLLLRELWANQEAEERGLTGRVLAFLCEIDLKEDDGKARSVPATSLNAWNKLITGLLEKRKTISQTKEPAIVECSPEARAILRNFHNTSIRLRNGVYRDADAQLGRWRENACRIGLGLCLADDPAATTLTAEQAQRAVQITRWAQLSALQLRHVGCVKALREKQVERWKRLCDLVSQHGGELTLRQLEKNHGFLPQEVESILTAFPTVLALKTKQNPNGGPQSRILTQARD